AELRRRMKFMKKMMMTPLVSGLAAFGAACSTDKEATSGGTSSAPSASPAVPTATDTSQGNEIPAAVRAALPNAQSITKQHKDLTDAQAARIEKQTGLKLDDKDHHSYLAFANDGGARKQIGAATLVNAGRR